MTRLNSAWRVLSDPERRRRYDLDLALGAAHERAARTVAEGRFPAAPPEPPPPTAQFRPRVWMLVVAVLAVIFVFTAYAAGRPTDAPKGGRPGQCLSARVEVYVACTEPNVGKLVTEVTPDQPCPEGTFRHILQARNQVACLTQS